MTSRSFKQMMTTIRFEVRATSLSMFITSSCIATFNQMMTTLRSEVRATSLSMVIVNV
jgi:hypothetical protein